MHNFMILKRLQMWAVRNTNPNHVKWYYAVKKEMHQEQTMEIMDVIKAFVSASWIIIMSAVNFSVILKINLPKTAILITKLLKPRMISNLWYIVCSRHKQCVLVYHSYFKNILYQRQSVLHVCCTFWLPVSNSAAHFYLTKHVIGWLCYDKQCPCMTLGYNTYTVVLMMSAAVPVSQAHSSGHPGSDITAGSRDRDRWRGDHHTSALHEDGTDCSAIRMRAKAYNFR